MREIAAFGEDADEVVHGHYFVTADGEYWARSCVELVWSRPNVPSPHSPSKTALSSGEGQGGVATRTGTRERQDFQGC
jgi:hypothetical protein